MIDVIVQNKQFTNIMKLIYQDPRVHELGDYFAQKIDKYFK